MGNGNYYFKIGSQYIFNIENNTISCYFDNPVLNDGKYYYYISRVNQENKISWSISSGYDNEQLAITRQQRIVEEIATYIENAGYLKPKTSYVQNGQYSGTIEQLTLIPYQNQLSAQTLEELEERPIVIEQTDKTDET